VTARTRLTAGAAGLAYVVAAAVENMEVLDAPLLGASHADIRAAHADLALGIVTSVAGALSLALYVVFAVAVRRRRAWVGAAGAGLAFAGVVAGAALVAGADASWLFEAQLRLRFAAGPLMALFLLAAAVVVPPPLRRLAWPIAAALALAPLAETGDHRLQVLAALAFAAHALWIWLAALWLLYGDLPWRVFARRAAFLMLVVAAGAVGLALLAVPRATGAFFAWTLRPAGLASFAGGIYVASAVVYAVGLRASWRAARPLVYGAVVLSVSVLAITLIHLEVFDLHRLQAWAWLFLFAGFGAVTIVLAAARPPADAPSERLASWARTLFALAAAALAVPGVALWADPRAFDLPPLGGRFAGSWTVMLAFLAAWAAVRNRRDEARLPALALVALPAGALVGAARAAPWTAPWFLAASALLCAAGVLLYRGTGWRGSYSPSGPKPGTSTLASTPQP
jgi:hypothetical protein